MCYDMDTLDSFATFVPSTQLYSGLSRVVEHTPQPKHHKVQTEHRDSKPLSPQTAVRHEEHFQKGCFFFSGRDSEILTGWRPTPVPDEKPSKEKRHPDMGGGGEMSFAHLSEAWESGGKQVSVQSPETAKHRPEQRFGGSLGYTRWPEKAPDMHPPDPKTPTIFPIILKTDWIHEKI